MRFFIEELEVLFPFPSIYREQYQYMVELKKALDAKGHCLLEMPTGTGKTVALLSLILSYQHKHTDTRKLVYCTRTVHEMTQVISELKVVEEYRRSVLGGQSQLFGMCLSSRRNLCINPDVIGVGDREQVDSLCRERIAEWARKSDADKKRIRGTPLASTHSDDDVIDIEDLAGGGGGGVGSGSGDGSSNSSGRMCCSFYENYERLGTDAIPCGIYSLDDLRELGRARGWCPYFAARHLLSVCNIVVYNYQYMLDPKIATLVSRELSEQSIVVFDEAHNIDNVCVEALSVEINQRTLNMATGNLTRLKNLVAEMRESDTEKLRSEYQRLLRGLDDAAAAPPMPNDLQERASPLPGFNAGRTSHRGDGSAQQAERSRNSFGYEIPEDLLQQAIPPQIKKASAFIVFMRAVVDYLKRRLNIQEVVLESPDFFMNKMNHSIKTTQKALRYCYSRLNSLLRTLQIINTDDFTPLSIVADFCTILSSYEKGFSIIMEPYDTRTPNLLDPVLHLTCTDASIAVKPVFDRFRSVVITSGTLSPLDLYPRMLAFTPVVAQSFTMSMPANRRACICPLIVSRGDDQMEMSTKFEVRDREDVFRNYGHLLINMAAVVPDGMVVFFPSYLYLEQTICKWQEEGVLQRVLKHKLLFIETKDVVETTLALDNFRRACDCGRGAIFFSVARGKVAEGINFEKHYGRAIIMIGIPYQYTQSRTLRARLDFMREEFQVQENAFLSFDAIRQTSQCAGRVIRSKADYGLMVFADKRYNSIDKRGKLPSWITDHLAPQHMQLDIVDAVALSVDFLRAMGQPIDKKSRESFLLHECDLKTESSASKQSLGGSKASPVEIDPRAAEKADTHSSSGGASKADSSSGMDVDAHERKKRR